MIAFCKIKINDFYFGRHVDVMTEPHVGDFIVIKDSPFEVEQRYIYDNNTRPLLLLLKSSFRNVTPHLASKVTTELIDLEFIKL